MLIILLDFELLKRQIQKRQSHLSLCVVEVSRHGNYGMRDLLAKVSLSGLLHLAQHHSRDLLGREDLFTLASLDLNMRLVVLLDDREREEFHIVLHSGIRPFAANQPLGVEHGVLRICRQLILGGVADQTLAVRGERNVGRRNSVTLIVGDDLYATVFVNSDTKRTRHLINLFDACKKMINHYLSIDYP